MTSYGTETMIIKYAVVPWLAMMTLGWMFGRYIVGLSTGRSTRSPLQVLLVAGVASLVVFAVVRDAGVYGDMFLPRTDNSWQQWLHVSKYPPSFTYTALELGLLCVILAALMRFEQNIGVRPNGVVLVFGPTALFFYLVPRRPRRSCGPSRGWLRDGM